MLTEMMMAVAMVVSPALPPRPTDKATTVRRLEAIKVRPEYSSRGYTHDAWGKIGKCSTWYYIARRDAISYVDDPNSSDPCRILSGKWRDPYSGRTITNLRDIAVEHIVPLSEAYQSGMKNFGRSKRYRLANDPIEMTISSDRENVRKGGSGVPDYLPRVRSFRCLYIKYYIRVKAKYGLTMDAREKVGVRNALRNARC